MNGLGYAPDQKFIALVVATLGLVFVKNGFESGLLIWAVKVLVEGYY